MHTRGWQGLSSRHWSGAQALKEAHTHMPATQQSPGAAAGQTECSYHMEPNCAFACIYVLVYIYAFIYFSLFSSNEILIWSGRKGNRIRPFVLSVFVEVLYFLSTGLCGTYIMYIWIYMFSVHVCLLRIHTELCCWLNMGIWSLSSLGLLGFGNS